MKLDVIRLQFGSDATNGILLIDGVFECFTLEDQVRDGEKVMSETAIPLGEYEVKFRTVGGYDARYQKKYGTTWHKGMLELQDVPNFKYILIHTGNTDEHTAGCLLVGETQQDLDRGKDGFVGGSGDAYKKMYPKVRDALLNGEKVTIKYSNINTNDAPKLSNKAQDDVMLTALVDKKFDTIIKELKTLKDIQLKKIQ
jgi:hypothetical protein|tara:strand:+ start:46 stop:639 length:594 start_codon:yes stop_codon:yes gene_type:complete